GAEGVEAVVRSWQGELRRVHALQGGDEGLPFGLSDADVPQSDVVQSRPQVRGHQGQDGLRVEAVLVEAEAAEARPGALDQLGHTAPAEPQVVQVERLEACREAR